MWGWFDVYWHGLIACWLFYIMTVVWFPRPLGVIAHVVIAIIIFGWPISLPLSIGLGFTKYNPVQDDSK